MRSWQSYLMNGMLRLVFKRQDMRSKTIAELREMFDKNMSRGYKPSPGVQHTPAEVGGVPGLWTERGGEDATLLYFHGGGYIIGSAAGYRDFAARLSAACGARVFAADYRLAPEHPHPAALDDAVACYRALLAGGVEPARLVVAGDSAGGGLTLATLMALRDAGDPLPAAAVCLSPWTDLSGSGDSVRSNAQADPMITPQALEFMAGHYAPGQDLSAPALSPVFGDFAGLPPMLLLVGDTEILRDDASRIADGVRAAGGEVRYEAWRGMPHVWPTFARFLPEGRAAVTQIGEFVRARVGEVVRAA